MKVLNVVQGSDLWRAARSKSHGASEAPVMMGASSRCTRSELVRMKATGDEKEFSTWVVNNLLMRGHEVEAFARAEVERMLGEDLYALTATDDDGYLLASPDGATIDGSTGFECKLWNEELAAQVRAGELGPEYFWQLEQQILVCGFEKIIFVVTDGTPEKFLSLGYIGSPGRAKQLMPAWRQFDADVANYQHVEVLPKAVAEPVMALPALAIDVRGDVSLVSNLALFGERLKAFIAEIPKKPETDTDFANCEAAVKALHTAEERLKTAEAAALARFVTVDEMRTTVAAFVALARDHRLATNTLVEIRKKAIRSEILQEGVAAFDAHITSLNKRLGRPLMQMLVPDFAGATKGRKTIASLRDAVATALANGKIAANATADLIDGNLKALAKVASGYEALFADLPQIVTKDAEHFQLLVSSRIAEYRAKEAARAEALREAIRAEEAAKLLAAVVPAPAPRAPPDPMVYGDRNAQFQRDLARECGPAVAKPTVARPARPSDDAIIWAISERFQVSEAEAMAWLLEIDFDAVVKRVRKSVEFFS